MASATSASRDLYLFAWALGAYLLVSVLGSVMSGWFKLRRVYPDSEERGALLLRRRTLTAKMSQLKSRLGWLVLEAHEQGLRLKTSRLFAPFAAPIFVPWGQLHVVRSDSFLGPRAAQLSFGTSMPEVYLRIDELTANQLWRSIGAAWPEQGTPPAPLANGLLRKRLFMHWLLWSLGATAFVLLGIVAMNSAASMHHAPPGDPYAPLLLLPAALFGSYFVLSYFLKRGSG